MSAEEKATKVHTSSYILKHIGRYPDLKFDGVTVMCHLCNVRLVSTNLFNWRKHLKSQKHQRNKELNFPYAMFLCDFVLLFSICNIPFNVLDKKPFRHFWKKFAPKWPLPSRTSAWRKISHVKGLIQEKIKEELRNNQVWLTVDETSDAKGNTVAHVLARVLQPNEPSPPYLIASKKLQEVSPEAIQKFVVSSLETMDVSSTQVLMLVTTSSRYMLRAGRLLKRTYDNLVHVTCLVHTLHLIAEEIRRNYPEVDLLMSNMSEVFLKSEKYTENFQSVCPEVPLPPQTDLARRTTWLGTVSYFHQHFHTIKSFMLNLNPLESQAVADVQEKFNNQQIEADLRTIHENYSILGDSVRKLGSSSLSLADSLDIFDDVQSALEKVQDTAGVQVNKKFNDVLKTNPDYRQLRFINQCLIDKFPVDSIQPFFMFANITSVDVERSFKHYANVFTARRRSFVESNMEALLLIQMYSQALPASAPPNV